MGFVTSGKLHVIGDTVQVSDRFSKREFVLETSDNPRYPQYVQFQLTGNRTDAIDGFNVGDQVQVDFSLRGREWTSPRGDVKYFNSLDVFTIERVGAGGPPGGDEPPLPDEPPPDLGDDEIPF